MLRCVYYILGIILVLTLPLSPIYCVVAFFFQGCGLTIDAFATNRATLVITYLGSQYNLAEPRLECTIEQVPTPAPTALSTFAPSSNWPGSAGPATASPVVLGVPPSSPVGGPEVSLLGLAWRELRRRRYRSVTPAPPSPSCDSPNTPRRFVFGARDVSLIGENPTVLRPDVVGMRGSMVIRVRL